MNYVGSLSDPRPDVMKQPVSDLTVSVALSFLWWMDVESVCRGHPPSLRLSLSGESTTQLAKARRGLPGTIMSRAAEVAHEGG